MGRSVVLTREPPRNDSLGESLLGLCDVHEIPLTATHYRNERDVESEIAHLSATIQFATIVVTSARAARYVSVARRHAPSSAVVAAVGPETASAVAAADPSTAAATWVQPDEATAAALASILPMGPALLLSASESRPELADVLRAQGISYSNVSCYETVATALTASQEELVRNADILVVAAPSAWRATRHLVSTNTVVVATGPTTAREVEQSHERVVVADLATVAATVGDVIRSLH